MWAMLAIAVVIVFVVVGVKNEKWHAARGGKQKPRIDYDFYDDNEDEKYISRTKSRREEKRQRSASRFKDDPHEDYETYTYEKSNEHSIDYDDYCDDCDEYHEE